MGQEGQLDWNAMLLQSLFNNAEIFPGANETFPELFLDATLRADVPSQFSQFRRLESISVGLENLDDSTMFRLQAIGIRPPSADVIQYLLNLPLFFPQFRPLAPEFGSVIASAFIEGHHLVDQLEIILVVEKNLLLSVVSEDASPEFDLFLETARRKLISDLIQGKGSRRVKARRQEENANQIPEH